MKDFIHYHLLADWTAVVSSILTGYRYGFTFKLKLILTSHFLLESASQFLLIFNSYLLRIIY